MNLDPITRKEMFMAKAAGNDAPDLEPLTREEWFLQQIVIAIEKGGGGGSDSNYLVRFDYDETQTDKITFDHGYYDILDALESNIFVYAIFGDKIGFLADVAGGAMTFVFPYREYATGVHIMTLAIGYISEFATMMDDVVSERPVETSANPTPTLDAENGGKYRFAEVTSMTINSTSNDSFWVIFDSGATPTNLTAAGVILPDGFTVEANKRYKITVTCGNGEVAVWTLGER